MALIYLWPMRQKPTNVSNVAEKADLGSRFYLGG